MYKKWFRAAVLKGIITVLCLGWGGTQAIGQDIVCGDANGDGHINIGDAVYIISYVFRGGSAPVTDLSGDANCDHQVNVGDAVYLVGFIFRGGPAPCAHCAGVCCLPDGNCAEVEEGECLSSGGRYLGDYTICGDGDPCNVQPLYLIMPYDGQVIGGTNVPVWAAMLPPTGYDTAMPIHLEYSFDGFNFGQIPLQQAPDFGKGSLFTTINTEGLPSGPFFIKAINDDTEIVRQVFIDQLPVIQCSVSGYGDSAAFDFTGTSDPDGGVDSIRLDFGDDIMMTTDSLMISHTYADTGLYTLEVKAYDTWGLIVTDCYIIRIALLAVPQVVPAPFCKCKKITIHAKKGNDSQLKDFRRPDPPPPAQPQKFKSAPLGPDPSFVSFNFEVEAELEKGSFPSLCPEKQKARGTTQYGDEPFQYKKACSAGKTLALCNEHKDCDTYKCVGGINNGQPVNTIVEAAACLLGGGTLVSNNDGICTSYPYDDDHLDRGNDDYTSPINTGKDMGPKLYDDLKIRWLDTPGLARTETAAANQPFQFVAEFVSEVCNSNGSCTCRCHFRLTIAWSGKGYMNLVTKIELVNAPGNLNVNCTLDN